MRTSRNLLGRYGLAGIATLAALVLEVWLQPVIFEVPFFVFALAVGLAAAYGGRGPGVLALVASAVLGNVFFHQPIAKLSYDTPSALSTLFFLAIGVVVIWLVSRYRSLVHELRRDRDRRTLIADASAELERSLDFESTLTAVAWLAVPRVADWCSVDLVREGVHSKLAVAHRDPEKIALLGEMLRRYPPPGTVGIDHVFATGEAVFEPRIARGDLEAGAVDAEHLAMLRRLDFHSYICVPIRRGEVLIGVLSVAMAESGRFYSADDLDLMRVLADRASIAIDRSQLFSEAQHQRTRAEQASRAKDEFLAILGHELRNPLAPIKIALELMADRDPDTFSKERTVIERQVRQLERLVDDLLDITRIVRGRIELRSEPLDLADVVARAVETTDPLIEERQHSLYIKVPEGLRVRGDEARLVQVVGNLLSNAAKYTEPGGRIVVSGAADDGHVMLRVRDNGMGIAPEMLPHVFDMFVQETQSLDRVRGGLGLGLAIVRNIIARHGGQVTAASEGTGRGSEFTIRLPALAVEPATAAPLEPDVQRPAAACPVLVVDDNRDALDLLADGLERRGIPTARAYDGPSALALAARVHPHVALLDIGLPVMDGYELARRLHELDESMQLVAITGYGRPGDTARAMDAGFVDHLVKPVSIEQVRSTVVRLQPEG